MSLATHHSKKKCRSQSCRDKYTTSCFPVFVGNVQAAQTTNLTHFVAFSLSWRSALAVGTVTNCWQTLKEAPCSESRQYVIVLNLKCRYWIHETSPCTARRYMVTHCQDFKRSGQKWLRKTHVHTHTKREWRQQLSVCVCSWRSCDVSNLCYQTWFRHFTSGSNWWWWCATFFRTSQVLINES